MGRACPILVVIAGCSFGHGTPIETAADASMTTASDAADAMDRDPDAMPKSWVKIETMQLATCCTQEQTAALSTMPLAASGSYLLRVSGTFTCTFTGEPADAEFWGNPPMDFASGIDFGVGIDDLVVDSAKPHWTATTNDHVYEQPYTGAGRPLQVILYDSQYDNNTGNLTLEIFGLK